MVTSLCKISQSDGMLQEWAWREMCLCVRERERGKRGEERRGEERRGKCIRGGEKKQPVVIYSI